MRGAMNSSASGSHRSSRLCRSRTSNALHRFPGPVALCKSGNRPGASGSGSAARISTALASPSGLVTAFSIGCTP